MQKSVEFLDAPFKKKFFSKELSEIYTCPSTTTFTVTNIEYHWPERIIHFSDDSI
jgi:hypothetical protein